MIYCQRVRLEHHCNALKIIHNGCSAADAAYESGYRRVKHAQSGMIKETSLDIHSIEPHPTHPPGRGRGRIRIANPIQAESIPLLLEGRDLVGCAQTGTGKTAAFAIPILQRLDEKPHNSAHRKAIRCLILTPTRELALQIGESLAAYGRHLPLKTAVIFGGVSQGAQTETLRRGVDILVATPGRLLDLIGQKFIELHHVEIFVLDEADRMLDMGFAPDVKRIIAMLPEIRQNMLFSATMPPEIVKLVDRLLNEPAKVAVTPVSSTVDTIDQSIYFVGKKEKRLLLTHLLKDAKLRSVLVFTRTKHGADRVARDLSRAGIAVAAIHGDKSQNSRVMALTQFKARKIRVLVATDIAARGIDVDDLSHVINFDLPNVPETYVHRIGRTGRAGLEGSAISFCDEEEKAYLKDIKKLIGKDIPVVTDQPYPLENYVAPEPVDPPAGQQRGRRDRQGAQSSREAQGRQGRNRQPDGRGQQDHRGQAEGHGRPESRTGQQTRTPRDARAPQGSPPAGSGKRRRSGRGDGQRDAKPVSKEQIEAFEREAGQLAGRRGHDAGRSGPHRDIVRDSGSAAKRQEPRKPDAPSHPADRREVIPRKRRTKCAPIMALRLKNPAPLKAPRFSASPRDFPRT